MSRPAELTPQQRKHTDADRAYAPNFGDNYSIEKLLELVGAVPGDMVAQYARSRLTIDQMRNKVLVGLHDNVMYIRNDMKVDEDKCSKKFRDKTVLLFSQSGGTFCVGARFETKWLVLADGKQALTGVPRDKLETALRGIGMLVARGVFDEQILALDDARRERVAQSKRKVKAA